MRLCSKCGLDLPVSVCDTRQECQDCAIQKARIKYRNVSPEKALQRQQFKHDYNKYSVMRSEVQLEVWQQWIEEVPKDYHALTEEEWQRALQYFDHKCAFCQINKFTRRGMFLTTDQGGRYCEWNVVPVCEVCVSRPRSKNPFRFMNRVYTGTESVAHQRRYSMKKLEHIVKYLEPLLLVAAKVGDLQKVQDTRNTSV